jgi:UDP-glucose 4-epimerase
MKNCIIFGGGGFIGSHIADELLKNGFEVIVFDKMNFDKVNIKHIEDKIKIIEGDFNNEIDIYKSLDNVDYVFHLVSSTLPASSNLNPLYDAETNLVSSLKLFTECLKRNIKKVIFISSGGTVYGIPEQIPVKESYPGKPICSYGIIKKTVEDYLYMYYKINGLDYTVFRLSNPYGERQNPFVAQGAIAVFLKKVLLNEQIEIWGDGNITRDYIYIKDAVKAVVKSLEVNSEYKILNLSSSIGYTLNEILNIIKSVSSVSPNVKYTVNRNIDVPVNILDNELIKKEFGWKPETSIENGIKFTYDYMKSILKK